MICSSDCGRLPGSRSARGAGRRPARVCARISTMPVTPIIGVRISWLIAARNAYLAWLASCARASLARSAASSCLIGEVGRHHDQAARARRPRRGSRPAPARTGTSWPSRCSSARFARRQPELGQRVHRAPVRRHRAARCCARARRRCVRLRRRTTSIGESSGAARVPWRGTRPSISSGAIAEQLFGEGIEHDPAALAVHRHDRDLRRVEQRALEHARAAPVPRARLRCAPAAR